MKVKVKKLHPDPVIELEEAEELSESVCGKVDLVLQEHSHGE